MSKTGFIKRFEEEASKHWNGIFTPGDVSNITDDADTNTYFVTVPYAYMNGKPHLGHAMTQSKAEFMSQYLRQKRHKVLFPVAFHASGMPIVAAAGKIKDELTHNDAKTEAQVSEETVDDTSVTSEYKTTYKSAKSKLTSKSGDNGQIDTMLKMGIPNKDINKFIEPWHWVEYFIPEHLNAMIGLGFGIDTTKSFTTTSKTPHYDAFVQWQFNKLYEQGRLEYGKRYTIWSPKDDQPCQDHDRSKGEGVTCQEYTLVKFKVDGLKVDAKHFDESKDINLMAATMRPETMYGLSNLWVHPELEYGIYQHEYESVNDYVVMLPRAAKNLIYQDHKLVLVKLIKGHELLGLNVTQCQIENPVPILPMLQINESKGTGIVSSVPSESPDDYLNLMVLQNKDHPHTKEMEEKYGDINQFAIKCHPVIIIDVGDSVQIAIDFCESKGFKNPKALAGNDLQTAKKDIYNKSRKGTFLVEEHKGKLVQDVIEELKTKYESSFDWLRYAEPESKVISRSGDECVVALDNQWYINYGETVWKGQVQEHMNTMEFYDKKAREQFQDGLNWLGKWPCSRTMGMGSKLSVPCPNPDDKNDYLIDSLSDSTLYMILYPIYHILKTIPVEDVSNKLFNWVYLNEEIDDGYPHKEKVEQMRLEYNFWCPMDLRVSGKDLTANHLIMCIYNHIAILPKGMWPKGFRINGHIAIDGEKMSKSTGNFITVEHMLTEYSADVTRLVLANASSEPIADTNYNSTGKKESEDELPTIDATISGTNKLFDMYQWIDVVLSKMKEYRTDDMNFFDKVFMNQINEAINNTTRNMDRMLFHEAANCSFHGMIAAKNKYIECVGDENVHQTVIKHFIDTFIRLNVPFVPHLCEYCYQKMCPDTGKSVRFLKYPDVVEVDNKIENQNMFINTMIDKIRNIRKLWFKKQKKTQDDLTKIIIAFGDNRTEWKTYVMSQINGMANDAGKKVDEMITEMKLVNQTLAKDVKLREFKLNFKKDVQKFVLSYIKNYEMYQFNQFELVKSIVNQLKNLLGVDVMVEFKEGVDPMSPLIICE